MMEAKQKLSVASVSLGLIFVSTAVSWLPGQQPAVSTDSATAQTQSDSLDGLSLENRTLFDTLRKVAQQNDDATTLASGKRLLPALKPGTPCATLSPS
jgi:hypothetical protein